MCLLFPILSYLVCLSPLLKIRHTSSLILLLPEIQNPSFDLQLWYGSWQARASPSLAVKRTNPHYIVKPHLQVIHEDNGIFGERGQDVDQFILDDLYYG
jgi:hypothetical protein